MAASITPRGRAASLAGGGPVPILAVAGFAAAFTAGGAQAQNATGGVLPLGLPPAAVILNAPFGPPPSTLGENSLRYQPAVPPAGGPNVPLFSIVPSIGLGELYNSNIFQSQTNAKGDFITLISPSIAVNGTTPRVDVHLQYAPTGEIYARTGSANGIAQQGIASGTAILVPDTLFVTARALASVQPSGGGLGGLGGFGSGTGGLASPLGSGFGSSSAPGALALSKNNRSQNFGASITPYAVHRFGSFGTAKAGLTLTESSISNNVTNPIPGTVTVGSQRQQTGEVTAQFESGQDFGRFRDFALVDATRSTGTGVLSGAHSAIATNWLGYGINRIVTPFAELGAESIHYNTAINTDVNGAVWELGVVLTPNADSQISIGYGHHQGFNAADISGFYQVTPRTRIGVSYTTALASNIQQIESQLGLANFDEFGNAVNAETGSPLFLGNGLLSTQNALFRTRTLGLTGTTVLDRDVINVAVQQQQQTPVGAAPGAPAGIGEQATSFSASWTHQISERTTLGVGGSYTRTSFQTAASGTEQFFAASAGASYLITETISTVARYSFFNRNSNFAGRTFTDNLFLLGVTKRF